MRDKINTFVKDKIEGLKSTGLTIVHAAKMTPGFLKEQAPLMLNPKGLYDLYQSGWYGGHIEKNGHKPEDNFMVGKKWFDRISFGFAVAPYAIAVSLGVVAVAAPASLPMIAFAVCYSFFPIAFKLNYDCTRAAEEKFSTKNAAGQTVSGAGVPIYRLSKAQDKITRLMKPFNDSAAVPQKVQRKIDHVLRGAAKDCAVVKAADGTPYKFAGLRPAA